MVLINDTPLGARQGAYINLGERLAPWGSCFTTLLNFKQQ